MIQNYCKFGNSHGFSPLDMVVNVVYRVPLVHVGGRYPTLYGGYHYVLVGGGYLIPLTFSILY